MPIDIGDDGKVVVEVDFQIYGPIASIAFGQIATWHSYGEYLGLLVRPQDSPFSQRLIWRCAA